MKDRMGNVDVMAVCTELRDLVGRRVGKIYQDAPELIRVRAGKDDLLIESGRRIHLTKYGRVSESPSPFCMLLRKHLSDGMISDISQLGFDRVVKIKIGERLLIAELMSRGNIILADSGENVIFPLHSYEFRDRKIRRGEKYFPPQEVVRPWELDNDQMLSILRSSGKDIVRTIATDLSLGGTYAEEICARAGVDKLKRDPSTLDAKLIYDAVREFFAPILEGRLSPRIVFRDGKTIDVVPVELKIYQGLESRNFEKFSDALDEFFLRAEEVEAERERIHRIYESQMESIKRMEAEREECIRKAEMIYSSYQDVESILSRLDGKQNVELHGMVIELDPRLSIHENAQIYYERAKELQRKIDGAKDALRRTMEKMLSSQISTLYPQRRVSFRRRWYDDYRWFITSDGFLVVGGRDAESNEELVSKHMDPQDVFIHPSVEGPVTLIKTEGRELTDEAIREAACFAASFSAYWKRGFYEGECFYVSPSQVSKSPPSGEYLAKGSFMIRGKRNYISVPIVLGIGVEINDETRLIYGPPSAIRPRARYYVELYPGEIPKEIACRLVREKFLRDCRPEHRRVVETLASIEELQRIIPGSCMMK